MLLCNKYKPSIFLDINDSMTYSKFINQNCYKISYTYNFKKKFVRTFIYFMFVLFSFLPFNCLNFCNKPSFTLQLNVSVFLVLDSNFYDNFYNC